jgi:hypothetical protein
MTNIQQPTTKPTTNNQQPTTDDQQPTTNNQQVQTHADNAGASAESNCDAFLVRCLLLKTLLSSNFPRTLSLSAVAVCA